MKLSFPLAVACAAILSLSACGGGGGDSSGNTVVNNPAALTKTDVAVGTGADAVAGARVQVNYTGWLYSAAAAEHSRASELVFIASVASPRENPFPAPGAAYPYPCEFWF